MKKNYVLFSLLLASAMHAQTNLDFETGDFTGWTGFQGDFNPSNQMPLTNVTTGITVVPVNSTAAHAIVDATYNAFGCSAFPAVGQMNYAAKLNSLQTTHNATGIKQAFTVTAGNAMHIFGSAIVITDGVHQNGSIEEAFFRTEVLDANGTVVIQKMFFPGMMNSPFTVCQQGATFYRPWTCDTLDLSPYIGQTVTVSHTASNCLYMGHVCWAFIDAGCEGPNGTNDKNTSLNRFAVLQNPSPDGLFTIQQSHPEKCIYKVLDITGKQLAGGALTDKISFIDLSLQSAGLYFLELQQPDGKKQVLKLVRG